MSGMKLEQFVRRNYHKAAIFAGIITLGFGLGLAFNLAASGFLIGLGAALIYIGREIHE